MESDQINIPFHFPNLRNRQLATSEYDWGNDERVALIKAAVDVEHG